MIQVGLIMKNADRFIIQTRLHGMSGLFLPVKRAFGFIKKQHFVFGEPTVQANPVVQFIDPVGPGKFEIKTLVPHFPQVDIRKDAGHAGH